MAPQTIRISTEVTSPLRWAGGKRWLLPKIRELLSGTEINAYHEPFLGGASVFLGLPPFADAHLSDSNSELIETFLTIRDHPTRVANLAHSYANDEATYYEIRAEEPGGRIGRAARFLYLNHTSFNGIYRVNLKGVYNVPYGHGRPAYIPTAAQLGEVAARLQGTTICTKDFAACVDKVNAGDLVFLDPPYTVAHNNNGFIKYNQKLFSFEDQMRLSGLIDEIKDRGAYYILTNAAHDALAKLFDKGDTRIQTSRRNSIGGTNAVRGSGTEYLFTNLK
jgi:DNA adenine methylase